MGKTYNFMKGGQYMKVTYVAKNYEISQRFKEVLESKLDKLERYFDTDVSVKVNCTSQEKREKLELTISSGSYFFKGEAISDNMYNNIDLALPKLERQIVRIGAKARAKSKKLAKENVGLVDLADELFEEWAPSKLIKTKRFALEPMTVDDAEAHMEALGHNFYVFENIYTHETNILYRRNDKNLGLIEIEE